MLLYVLIALVQVLAAAPIQPLPQNGTSSAAPSPLTHTHTDKPHTHSPPHTTKKRPAEPAQSLQDKIIQKPKESPQPKVTNKPKISLNNEATTKSKKSPEPKATNKPKKPSEPQATNTKPKKPTEPKTSNYTEATTGAKTNSKNKPKVKEVPKSKTYMPKVAPKPKQRNAENKRVPPIEAFVLGPSPTNMNGNGLDDVKPPGGSNDRFLADFKEQLQKDNDDYREIRREINDQQSRRMQRKKLDPALAVLLPNSKEEGEEELLKSQVNPALNLAVNHALNPAATRRMMSREILPDSWLTATRRPPQHLMPAAALASSQQRMLHVLTKPPPNELRSKNKRYKLKKLAKFIKKNKGLLNELIAEKRLRGRPGGAQEIILRTRAELGEAAGADIPVMRANNDQLRGEKLDLVHARGSKISELRIKGRICSRNTLNIEGPKYNSHGQVTQVGFDEAARNRKFEATPPYKLLLPICCNCCAKSVLGCE